MTLEFPLKRVPRKWKKRLKTLHFGKWKNWEVFKSINNNNAIEMGVTQRWVIKI